MVDGLGSEVLPQPYQQEATPTPRLTAPFAALNNSVSARARCQWGFRAVEAFANADATFQPLARDRFGTVTKRIDQAKLQPIDAKLAGEFVVKRFLHDRRLRHAEAAKGAGNRPIGVDGTAGGAIVRRPIWARCVNRHAVCHRRTETRIGASVEIALKNHSGNETILTRADRRSHRSGMTFGGRHHGFGAAIGDRGRAAGFQRNQPDQRLDGNIDLGAKAAAGRGGHDAHLVQRQTEHLRRVFAGPYAAPGCRR